MMPEILTEIIQFKETNNLKSFYLGDLFAQWPQATV